MCRVGASSNTGTGDICLACYGVPYFQGVFHSIFVGVVVTVAHVYSGRTGSWLLSHSKVKPHPNVATG